MILRVALGLVIGGAAGYVLSFVTKPLGGG